MEDPSAVQVLAMLYERDAPLMRTTARLRFKIPPDDADALVHDVFASFLERQPRADDVRAYLLGAIGNACKHYWRKRQYEAPLLSEYEDRTDTSAVERMELWALNLSLGAVLARLGSKCRETLERYYLGDERPESIARDLVTTVAYVFQLLHTCRKRAREIYLELAHTVS
jgi:RNA polymerase sigma factor (sigma-70 family)